MNFFKSALFCFFSMVIAIISPVFGVIERPQLCQGWYQSEEAAREQLKRFSQTYNSLREWELRGDNIRRQILRGAELWPLPEKCPLNPIIHSKRTHNGYTVENVAFECWPGVFVTGNLYRPVSEEPSYAAILSPHGHFSDSEDPNESGRFRSDMQKRCATLARMGAVVFAYDMVGWGESTQSDHHHSKAIKKQLWSGIRAIDFLLSLPEVDPSRIGITGASGGGTQTFLLAAVDDRIRASVPTVMVSAHFFGGCVCESGMPIHKSAHHETNNAEIAALAAPRPQLIISVGKDWTRNTPIVEFPYINTVYGLYKAGNNIENFHLPDEGHDYGFSKRKPMYRFFAKHFNLDLDNVAAADGSIDESGTVLHNIEKLSVFTPEHPRPESAKEGIQTLFKLHLQVLPDFIDNRSVHNMMRRHWLEEVDKTWQEWKHQYEWRTIKLDYSDYQKDLKEKFRQALGAWPEPTPLKPRVTGSIQRQGYCVEKIIFQSQPDFYVTGSLYLPENHKYQAPYPGVLIPCGHFIDAKAHDEYQSMGALLALNGMAAFVIDPIDQGERMQLLDKNGDYMTWGVDGHLMLGVGSILLGRNTAWFEVYDGMRAIDYLQSRPEIDPERIGCTGNSGGGVQTAYLMSLDNRIKAAAVSCYLHRLSRQVETSFGDAEQNIYAQLAFGMEHADYMMMRAPLPLLVCAATKDFFDINATWESFRYAKRFYTRLGVPERIALMENDEGHNYNFQQRQAIAHWMKRWLRGEDEPVIEPAIDLIPEQQLRCTPKGEVMLMDGAKNAYDINADEEKKLAQQRKKSWEKTDKESLLQKVREVAGIRSLEQLPVPEIEHAGIVRHLSCQVEKLVIKPAEDIYLPALLFKPESVRVTQAAIYLHQDGKEADAYPGGPIEQLLKEGNIVLAVDVRGSGETQAKVENYFVQTCLSDDWMDIFSAYLLGQSYVGIRAEDILICARFVAGYIPGSERTAVKLVAVGNLGVPALHAAALESNLFKSITLKRTLVAWSDVVRTPLAKRQLINAVHGALRIYDLPDLAAALGDKLTAIEPLNAKNLPYEANR